MKNFKLFLLALTILAGSSLSAQVAITPDGSEPDPSAMLDVKSTNKGVLFPRMTTEEIQSISNPANGLIVFCTTDNNLYTYIENESKWKNLYFVQDMCIPFVDIRDGKQYKTVQIGDQCWMAENLNYDQSAYGNDYCYDNETSNCDTYGRLYDWAAVMQGAASSNNNPSGVQGVCPYGWHLPSDAEWTELTTYVSSQTDYLCNSNPDYIAKALAATLLWNTDSETCAIGNILAANNATGFTALPGGWRSNIGDFTFIDNRGYFWSSTEWTNASLAWSRLLINGNADALSSIFDKDYGFSVRCLRD